MRDTDDEIREIKKEIIESRGLVIRTNNLTNALAADIKSIARRQAGYERRFNLNSAIAYVTFATLSFVGLKLWSDVRIREIESEKTELLGQVSSLRRELHEETRLAERRTRAEAKAARFYELIRQQKRAEAVDAYDSIRREQLSSAEVAFFRDAVDRFRLDLSVSAYQAGLDQLRTDRYAEAAESFQESLRLNDQAAHSPSVKYHLARSLHKLGRQGEASLLAQAVLTQNIERDLQDDAAWLLSQCAEELGNLDEARNAIKTLLRRWPHSTLAPLARKRLSDLNRSARLARSGGSTAEQPAQRPASN